MTTLNKATAAATAAIILSASPVLAATQVSTGVHASSTAVKAGVAAKIDARLQGVKEKADAEIDRRITALNEMTAKVQAMAKVSGDTKGSVAALVSSEIANLTALKSKIEAETDLTALKTDVKSITGSYRIFALVIPQGRVEVAADKIVDVASSLMALSGKLQARIETAKSAGRDVADVSAKLADLNTKVADANTQASAAASAVATLAPDNGNATKAEANAETLKESRAKIKIALKDIDDARSDAKSIVKTLKGWGDATSTPAVSH